MLYKRKSEKRRKILTVIICAIVLFGISMIFMRYKNTAEVAGSSGVLKENIEKLDTESSNEDELPSV